MSSDHEIRFGAATRRAPQTAAKARTAPAVPRNRHAIVRNPHGTGERDKRWLIVGATDGGRVITLVIERTIDPTTWLIVTGWSATDTERNLLERWR